MTVHVSERESTRLAALRRLEVLDTAPEAPFDNIVGLVRSVLGVPMASVTLVDAERQWFKARCGIAHSETAREISFCTHTVSQDAPLVIPDALADIRFRGSPLVTDDPGIRSYAGVQLTTSDGHHVGTLCAIDTRPREYSAREVALLSEFAKVVMTEMELHRRADIDHLTGVYTRQAFVRHAAREIARHARYGAQAALIVFDIDHFKHVNDTYGHPAGDAVLQAVAARVQGAIRPIDYHGRIGGEEFAVLMPGAGLTDAMTAAERLRSVIAQSPVACGTNECAVTASFGVSPLDPAFADLAPWLAEADARLYSAKRNGRNRCEAVSGSGRSIFA